MIGRKLLLEPVQHRDVVGHGRAELRVRLTGQHVALDRVRERIPILAAVRAGHRRPAARTLNARRVGFLVAIRTAEPFEGKREPVGQGVEAVAIRLMPAVGRREFVRQVLAEVALEPAGEAQRFVLALRDLCFAFRHRRVAAQEQGSRRRRQIRSAVHAHGRERGVLGDEVDQARVRRRNVEPVREERRVGRRLRLLFRRRRRQDRIERRRLPMRNIDARIETVDEEAVARRHVDGQRAVDLQLVFLFLQIVEVGVLHLTDRRRAAEAGIPTQRRALRVARQRRRDRRKRCEVEERAWTAGRRPAAFRIVDVLTLCKVAVQHVEFAAMLIADRQQPVHRLRVVAIDAARRVVAVRVVDEAPVASEVEAVIALPRDEVHDAADRIRPVGHGRAVFQNLDPVECGDGNDVRVDDALPCETERVQRETAPVQQDQRSRRSKPAQIDGRRALRPLGAGVELVGVADDAVRNGQGLRDFDDRRRAVLFQIFRCHDVDG